MALFSTKTSPAKGRTQSTGKNSKATKSRVVTGGVKTKNPKKIAFFSIVGILALTVLGYSGYVLYQNHSHGKLAKDVQAHAANYGAVLVDNSNVRAVACWKQYSSSKPDEVWVMVGRKRSANLPNTWDGVYIQANKGDRVLGESFSGAWWGGTLQLHKLSVGRANILNNAYIEGFFTTYQRGMGGNPSGQLGSIHGSGSLTSAYGGSRIAQPGRPDLRYPLIKGLPVCTY